MGDHEPLMWRLIEGAVVNILVAIALIGLVFQLLWGWIEGLIHKK
jgi:hypothetical protein